MSVCKFLVLLAFTLVIYGCVTKPSVVISLSATEDFAESTSSNFIPFYTDKKRQALAINAVEYKGDFAMAVYEFIGESNQYQLKILTMGEEDGESTYELWINDEKKATVQNSPTNEAFENQEWSFGKVTINNGDKIGITFNSHTNGKIPEGNTTAYSRGRWTSLVLTSK